MEFVDKLIKHPIFTRNLKEIELEELDRAFCCHGMTHLMDVARIAYIYSLEHNLKLEKEIIYLTALLHDIGRAEEYRTGAPHEQAGMELAELILSELEYPEEKQKLILKAIENHRSKETTERYIEDNAEQLKFIINMADKQSRNCFYCDAYKQCNWSEGKKNKTITQ